MISLNPKFISRYIVNSVLEKMLGGGETEYNPNFDSLKEGVWQFDWFFIF